MGVEYSGQEQRVPALVWTSLSPVLCDLLTVRPRVGKSLKPQIPHISNGNGHSTYSLYIEGVIKAG